jgi:hypothetical protein
MMEIIVVVLTSIIGTTLMWACGAFDKKPSKKSSPAPVQLCPEFSDEVWSQLAMKMIWPTPHYHGTIEGCDKDQRDTDEKRQKFAFTEPPKLRRHIMDWLDFCDKQIQNKRDRIRNGSESDRLLREYSDKQERLAENTQKLKECLGVTI